MHRVLALLLIPALMATSGVASLQHTHVYADHHHPEHHHGLAAHEHTLTAAHPAAYNHGLEAHNPRSDDGLTRVEGCDPGKHRVAWTSLRAAVPSAPVVVAAERAATALPGPGLQTWQPVGYADVRVHGPPSRSQASPRAPPVAPHA